MKHIAIIAGGDSSEYEVSLRSSRAVAQALSEYNFRTTIVNLSKKGWATEYGCEIDRNDFSFKNSTGAKENFDAALIMIHGTPGENGILQGYFELIGMPYTGCSVEVSALTFNKSITKLAVKNIAGINLAREILMSKGDPIESNHIIKELGLPLFVKPNASGSSCGVTKVKMVEQLVPAIETALKECDAVLLEEFIEGTEVSQGVMLVEGEMTVLPMTELMPNAEFFDYQAKYTPGGTEEITPARISNDLTAQISAVTERVYKTLGCRGVVRVDYIIKESKPYFIEINTNPGMSNASIVPQQWAYIGLTMGQAWTKIINEIIK